MQMAIHQISARPTDARCDAEQSNARYRILDQIGPACAKQRLGLDVGSGVVAGMIVPVEKGVSAVVLSNRKRCNSEVRSRTLP